VLVRGGRQLQATRRDIRRVGRGMECEFSCYSYIQSFNCDRTAHGAIFYLIPMGKASNPYNRHAGVPTKVSFWFRSRVASLPATRLSTWGSSRCNPIGGN
jgi:hypothetical protein